MQINARYYSIFRIIFGILMIPQVYSIVPSIHDLSNSIIVFHYPGLEFIEAYTHELVDGIAGLAIISAVGLAIGYSHRLFSIVFLVSFGYLFLIDISFYNNHYYLWCLIALLIATSSKENHVSIFKIFDKNFIQQVRVRDSILMGLLISIVYFFGGIAKINDDWLQGYPMRIFMHSKGISNPDLVGYFVSYFGLFFDLFVPFLIWKFSKKWYFILPYFGFHLANYFLFNIGEFPFVMIGALIIFLPLQDLSFEVIKNELIQVFKANKLIALFFLFQIIWPLRHFVIPGNVNWNRQGYYFAWRMMLNNQEVKYFQFQVRIPEINKQYFIQMNKVMSHRQYMNCYNNPYLIWKMAQKFKDDAIVRYGTKKVEVYARSLVTLNQHPEKNLIHEVDLTKVDYKHFGVNKFITTIY